MSDPWVVESPGFVRRFRFCNIVQSMPICRNEIGEFLEEGVNDKCLVSSRGIIKIMANRMSSNVDC